MSRTPSPSNESSGPGAALQSPYVSPHEASPAAMDVDNEEWSSSDDHSGDEKDDGLDEETNGGQRERIASVSLSVEPALDGGTEGSNDQRSQIRRAAAHSDSRLFAQKPAWPPVDARVLHPQPPPLVLYRPPYPAFVPYIMSYPQMYAQGPPMPMHHPSAYGPSPYPSYGMYGPYDRPYSSPDPYDSVRYSGARPMPGYAMPPPYGYYPRPMTGMSDSSMSSMGSHPYSPPNGDSPDRIDPLSSHTRKRPGEHIPRPRNAFIFYRSWIIKSNLIPQSLEPDHRNLSRIAGEMWRKLTDEEREPYNEMARKEKEMHKLKYPKYRYTPAQRTTPTVGTTDGGKRRVHRRPEADAEERKRCAEVASLLGQGVKGAELEKKIREEFKQSPPSTAKRVRPRQPRKSDEYNDDSDSESPEPGLPSATPEVRSSPETQAPKESTSSPTGAPSSTATGRQYWTPSVPTYTPSAREARPFFAGTDNPHSFNALASTPDSVPTASSPFEMIGGRVPQILATFAVPNVDAPPLYEQSAPVPAAHEQPSSVDAAADESMMSAGAAERQHSVSNERAAEAPSQSGDMGEGMYCEPSAGNEKYGSGVTLYYGALGHLPDYVQQAY